MVVLRLGGELGLQDQVAIGPGGRDVALAHLLMGHDVAAVLQGM